MLYTHETKFVSIEETKYYDHMSLIFNKLESMNELELAQIQIMKIDISENVICYRFPDFFVTKTAFDDGIVVSSNGHITIVFFPELINFAEVQKDEAELLLNHLMTITI
jgi:hypothetical protein